MGDFDQIISATEDFAVFGFCFLILQSGAAQKACSLLTFVAVVASFFLFVAIQYVYLSSD